MDIRSVLQANCQKLLEQYELNLTAVLELQSTLIIDILPHVEDELHLSPEAVSWAKEWLEDTATFFQFCRRQNYTKSLAMEAIRKNLVWRLQNLLPAVKQSPSPTVVHCLPVSAHDPFGRPIIVLRAADFEEPTDETKRLFPAIIELLRLHLAELNSGELASHTRQPVLQYVVLLDLKNVSFKNINIDVITWAIREIIPRFPGMLAAVFMINYSWAHSGIWAIIKRVLPASALSRIFFASHKELEQYISPSSLPQEYGGELPSLDDLYDPLRPLNYFSRDEARPQSAGPIIITDILVPPSKPVSSHTTSISPTSFLNPFFGYPVSLSTDTSCSSVPTLHHGRRRKRDLVRTLAFLWWMRYGRRIRIVAFWLLLFGLTIRLWTRKRSRFPEGLSLLRAFWSTGMVNC